MAKEIKEHSIVVLTKPFPVNPEEITPDIADCFEDNAIPEGTQGCVVNVYNQGEAFEVEFSREGLPTFVETITKDFLELFEVEYKVTINRIGFASRDITVFASNPEAAAYAAEDEAGGLDFSEHASDYEVEAVMDMKSFDVTSPPFAIVIPLSSSLQEQYNEFRNKIVAAIEARLGQIENGLFEFDNQWEDEANNDVYAVSLEKGVLFDGMGGDEDAYPLISLSPEDAVYILSTLENSKS